MTFKSFWTLYLEHHSLPGTRLLHYFATTISLLSAVEAIVMGRPLVLLAGIVVGYAIAITSHWLVERNPPLIGVNAIWGALAELHMCWLALRGRLFEDLSSGEVLPRHHQEFKRSKTARASLRGRYVMLMIGMLGLVAGLLDLDDIFEPQAGLHYPIIQLGVPLLAFAVAIVAGMKSITLQRPARSVTDIALRSCDTRSVNSDSLWRAHLLLLAFGVTALAMAESAEAGFHASTEFYLAAALLIGALCCIAFVIGAAARRLAASSTKLSVGSSMAKSKD